MAIRIPLSGDNAKAFFLKLRDKNGNVVGLEALSKDDIWFVHSEDGGMVVIPRFRNMSGETDFIRVPRSEITSIDGND